MIASGHGRAVSIEAVPIRGLDARAMIAIELDADGRLVGGTVKPLPPHAEGAEDRAARELAEAVLARLRRIGSLAEALERARQALELLENLAALEEALAPEARALLAREGAFR
jgi:hypothetical protein